MRLLTAVSLVRVQQGELSEHEVRYVKVIPGSMVKRLRHRPFTAVTWVRFPYGSPRRRKLYIACDDFLCFASKVISRSLRCPKGLALRRSSFPNQTRLRLGFDSVFLCPQNWPGVPKQISPPKVGWFLLVSKPWKIKAFFFFRFDVHTPKRLESKTNIFIQERYLSTGFS